MTGCNFRISPCPGIKPIHCSVTPKRCTLTPTSHCTFDKEPSCTAHLEQQHFTEPQPIVCKWCGSVDTIKHGMDKGVQQYLCSKCGRKFNEKDAPYGMQSTFEEVGVSLDMYYQGLSLTKITKHLFTHYNDRVERSTVYRWLIHFTQEAVKVFAPLHPQVSDTWIADETSLIFQDRLHWIWDVMCRDTRFLLASYLSPNRGTKEAQHLMELAAYRANKAPAKIITDSLRAYLDGIELVFGSDTKHIQSGPFAETDSTNRIERMQGTIRERTKVVRGYKTLPTARIIMDGFMINYNMFRPHLSLKNRTPAQAAKLELPANNWTELVRKVGLR